MKSRRGNPVLPLGKTNAAGVVTDLSAIISGNLKLLTNLVVTTPAALVKNLRFLTSLAEVERCFTGLPRLDFRQGS